MGLPDEGPDSSVRAFDSAFRLPPSTFSFGILDHLEGPKDRPSRQVYDEVEDLVRLADSLGIEYFWFAEHHAHAHRGHLPTPLLMALHLAGKTTQIRLGTGIICLNLHHPLDVAGQIAVADCLMRERLHVGFGSGSTPEEFRLFRLEVTEEVERHARCNEALREIRQKWEGTILPAVRADLPSRCWLATNSIGAAKIAGAHKLGMLFSHLRTPSEHQQYIQTYRESRGTGPIAANRPVYVGETDESAWAEAEEAIRILWRRFRSEGKIPSNTPEPRSTQELCDHPLNFIVGGPETAAQQLVTLHAEVPFDLVNLEVRWDGLTHELVRDSLERLATVVRKHCLTSVAKASNKKDFVM